MKQQQMKTKPRSAFPRTVARFTGLKGGYYGTIDLLAQTADRLELQMGADFVELTPEEAVDLRDALQTFIEFTEKRERGAAATEEEALEEREVAAAVEVAEETALAVEGARPRRRKAREPRERESV